METDSEEDYAGENMPSFSLHGQVCVPLSAAVYTQVTLGGPPSKDFSASSFQLLTSLYFLTIKCEQK